MNNKGHCYPKSNILQALYFKLRVTLGYRDVEQIIKISEVFVNHAKIQRWVYKFKPYIESEMKNRMVKAARWSLDETYIKVKGIWCYLYRAVDKLGNTVDFLLTRKRQRMSAQSFLIKAIGNNFRPRVINIDKSGSNTAAIKVYKNAHSQRLKSGSVNISTIFSNRNIDL